MVAVTVDSSDESVSVGNVRMLVAQLSSVDNTDTWDTGFKEVLGWSFTATTDAAVGATESAGVFTFANTGTLVVNAVVFGK